MVPVHTVAILGTTDIKVEDPDEYEITRDEVGGLIREGEKMFPDLPRDAAPARLRRRAAALPAARRGHRRRGAGRPPDLARPRGPRPRRDQGVDNFVSIVGGKLTTLPPDGRGDGRRGARPSSASRRRAPRPTRSCPTRCPARPTGWATAWRTTRPRAAATPTSCASASSSRGRCSTTYLDRHWPCTHRRRPARDPRRDGPVPGGVLHVPGRGPSRAPGRAHAATGSRAGASAGTSPDARSRSRDRALRVPPGALQGHPAHRRGPPAPGADG